MLDAYHRQGLGRLLVGTLGCVAQARGLSTFTAVVLADNRAMRTMLDKVSAPWARSDFDLMEARIPVASLAAFLDAETAQSVVAASLEMAQAARLADA